MASRKKFEDFYTPKGSLQFPKLRSFDNGYEDKNKDNPDFSTNFVAPAEAIEKMVEKHRHMIDDHMEAMKREASELPPRQGKPKLKKLGEAGVREPFKEVLDEDGEPTGELSVKFSTKAFRTFKKNGVEKREAKTLAIVDAKQNYLPKSVEPWGGSEGRIKYTPKPYYIESSNEFGIKFYLNAIQITKLVYKGNASSDGSRYGFGEDEDGEAFDADAFEEETQGGLPEEGTHDEGDQGSDDFDDEIPF